jgi:glutathione S-transferase
VGLRIVGSPLSPYVRKVLVCLDLKGLECELDPIVPFFGGDRFSALSPLRRIPVLTTGPKPPTRRHRQYRGPVPAARLIRRTS